MRADPEREPERDEAPHEPVEREVGCERGADTTYERCHAVYGGWSSVT